MVLGDIARGALQNVVKSAAPRGAKFNGRRRVVRSAHTRLADITVSTVGKYEPAGIVVLGIIALFGCFVSLWKERRRRSELAVISATPLSKLTELCHVLRGGHMLTDHYCLGPGHFDARPPPLNPACQAITDEVFVRVDGELWVSETDLVRAPFSKELVAFYEATVTRLFDEWVTRVHRRRIKAGRKKGERSQDDPGSDSEYEETEQSFWECREALQTCTFAVAPRLYVDDGTGRALVVAPDAKSWAGEQAEAAFRERGPAQQGVAASLFQATVGNQRERGVRCEERVLRASERLEVLGEARVEGGSLVIRAPSRVSEQLHRLQSLPFGDVTDKPSPLLDKIFAGTVLRGRAGMSQTTLAHAARWRLAKWFLGWLSSLLALLALSRSQKRMRDLRIAGAKTR